MKKENELHFFTDRLRHVANVNTALERATRGKRFRIYGEPMWSMALSERDMVAIDLASWAKGFYSRGGFLRRAQASKDLRALSLEWKHPIAPEIASINAVCRRECFDRLFPCAVSGVPCPKDVDMLVTRLHDEFEPLLDDRHRTRAHKYESDHVATAKMLGLDEVADYLATCVRLLRDIRFLASNGDWHPPSMRIDAEDKAAEDVVDLILCGTIGWIVQDGAGAIADSSARWSHFGRSARRSTMRSTRQTTQQGPLCLSMRGRCHERHACGPSADGLDRVGRP